MLHFSRRTLSGVPFSFTIETEACRGKDVCREIMSLVDALDPERCVLEWMMKSGTMFPLQFDRAVADMEDIRTRTWLLAYDLGVSSGLMQPIPFS